MSFRSGAPNFYHGTPVLPVGFLKHVYRYFVPVTLDEHERASGVQGPLIPGQSSFSMEAIYRSTTKQHSHPPSEWTIPVTASMESKANISVAKPHVVDDEVLYSQTPDGKFIPVTAVHKSSRVPQSQALHETKRRTVEKGEKQGTEKDELGDKVEWDGWPDGKFERDFTYSEVRGTNSLAMHWAHTFGGGDRRGDVFADEWEKGKKATRKCLGVIECDNFACEVTVRPNTRPDRLDAQLSKSCSCGAVLSWKQCGVRSILWTWKGGIHYSHEGEHFHRPPHKLHLLPEERDRFEALVKSHPKAGPLQLIVGVPGVHGPGHSVADISDVLLNADRVSKERKSVKRGADTGGDSFIRAFSDFEVNHPGFIIASTLGRVTVISLQTKFMRSQLLKEEILNEPVNGMVNDAAHGWWKERTSLLMVTSTYCPVLSCWVPGVLSFTNGATTDHFMHHFLAVFQGIVDEAEVRGMEIEDRLFAGVKSLEISNKWQTTDSKSQVMDFSEAERSGFITAFTEFWYQHPNNARSRAELEAAAQRLLRGCEEHFRAGVTHVSRISGAVPPEMSEEFVQRALSLLKASDSEDFRSCTALLARDFPKLVNWINWWSRESHAMMLFGSERKMDTQHICDDGCATIEPSGTTPAALPAKSPLSKTVPSIGEETEKDRNPRGQRDRSPSVEEVPDPDQSAKGPFLPAGKGPLLELEATFSGGNVAEIQEPRFSGGNGAETHDPPPHLPGNFPAGTTSSASFRSEDERSVSTVPTLGYLHNLTPSPSPSEATENPSDAESNATERPKKPTGYNTHSLIFEDLPAVRDLIIRDEPISCSNYRYHPDFDPSVDYDPITQFGGVDGLLPGRNRAESDIVRDLIIRWTAPHNDLLWINLSSAIQEFQKLRLSVDELVQYGDGATRMYSLNKPRLEEIAQLLLARRTETAAIHIRNFFKSLDRIFNRPEDVDSISSYNSTRTSLRSIFGLHSPRTELRKLTIRPDYQLDEGNSLYSAQQNLIRDEEAKNENAYYYKREKITNGNGSTRSENPPFPTISTARNIRFELPESISNIAKKHTVSSLPGVGTLSSFERVGSVTTAASNNTNTGNGGPLTIPPESRTKSANYAVQPTLIPPPTAWTSHSYQNAPHNPPGSLLDLLGIGPPDRDKKGGYGGGPTGQPLGGVNPNGGNPGHRGGPREPPGGGNPGNPPNGGGGGGGPNPDGSNGNEIPLEGPDWNIEEWQLNNKLNSTVIPSWDGMGESVLSYISSMAKLADLSNKMRIGLAKLAPSNWTGRVLDWWDALPQNIRVKLSRDWNVMLLAIRYQFLDDNWVRACTFEFEEMRFRQTNHEKEMPIDYLQRCIRYHSFLYPEDLDGPIVVARVLRTKPTEWDNILNENLCPLSSSPSSLTHEPFVNFKDLVSRPHTPVLPSVPPSTPQSTSPLPTAPAQDDMVESEVKRFHGRDDDENESPKDFLKDLERTFMQKSWNDTQKVAWFELSLLGGSPAEEWYESLPATTTAVWTDLRAAFRLRWPAKTAVRKTQEERQAELMEAKIKEATLGLKVKVNGTEVWTHVAWADKVERLARAIPDDNNLLVQSTRECMAPSLKALVPRSNNTWSAFCRAVKDVDVTELKEKKSEGEKSRKMEADLKELKALRQRPTTQSLVAKFSQMGLGSQPTTSPYSAPAKPNTPYPATPGNATQGRTDAAKWEIIRHLPAPLPDTPANRATYQVQVTSWHTTYHGRNAATEDRPYPLRPGTCALGSGKCNDCGMMGHGSNACASTTKLPDLEIKWRRKANSIKNALARAGATVPVNFVGAESTFIPEAEYRARVAEELRQHLEAEVRAQVYAELFEQRDSQGKGQGSSD
ncbi:hypothetical protein D9615_007525 [Tricholomella constricta]|uniref:CCHC-type domain-containing protein n=1 Tax=Tricholomella constricta TaxID=117010 RepID=A0A8H5H7N6_9AGAR|nr:hypothetical protein D9615_007525 [Tricholomella constricta]